MPGTDDLLLAGDVGGTKTTLAAMRATSGDGARTLTTVADATFENRRYGGLDAIVDEFLHTTGVRVRRASLSVAGPVVNGSVVLTNLGWRLEERSLRESFGLVSAHLLNDLQATAYAVPALPPEHVVTLQPGEQGAAAGERRVRAVIAPGTGLGEAFLIAGADGVEAFPSEGGNADFAPADDTQMALLAYMRERVGHVRCEHVCSGIGIANLYRFLKDTGRAEEPAWLTERLARAVDPAPVLGEAALEAAQGGAPAPIATRTMEIFVDVLGAESGSLALRMLPAGGVYVGGGIPPRILPLLQDGRFLRAFRAKGVFTALMSSFPVCVILDPRAAVLGAAAYALARAAAEGVAAAPRVAPPFASHQP